MSRPRSRCSTSCPQSAPVSNTNLYREIPRFFYCVLLAVAQRHLDEQLFDLVDATLNRFLGVLREVFVSDYLLKLVTSWCS